MRLVRTRVQVIPDDVAFTGIEHAVKYECTDSVWRALLNQATRNFDEAVRRALSEEVVF
jgi:hypothetical protein